MESDGALFGYIWEFLSAQRCDKTLKALESETRQLGKKVNIPESRRDRTSSPSDMEAKVQELKQLYDKGDPRRFIPLLYSVLKGSIRTDDPTFIKLEFYCHLHCLLWPFVQANKTRKVISPTERQRYVELFKSYLRVKGTILSSSPEFLPYFTLVVVPHPEKQPSLAVQMQEEWHKDLWRRLEVFVKGALRVDKQVPKLYSILNVENKESSVNNTVDPKVWTALHSLCMDVLSKLDHALHGDEVSPDCVAELSEALNGYIQYLPDALMYKPLPPIVHEEPEEESVLQASLEDSIRSQPIVHAASPQHHAKSLSVKQVPVKEDAHHEIKPCRTVCMIDYHEVKRTLENEDTSMLSSCAAHHVR